jgi:DNA-binding NtrC family response regulator
VHMTSLDQPIEDDEIAGQTDMPLLITGETWREIEGIARRVHLAGPRARAPFVAVHVGELPAKPGPLQQRLSALFDRAAGGSLLLTMAEDMPPAVQGVLADLMDDRRRAEAPASTARLISGTTVSLFDRVTAGTFSDRLFYRLNSIHLVAPPRWRTAAGAGPDER